MGAHTDITSRSRQPDITICRPYRLTDIYHAIFYLQFGPLVGSNHCTNTKGSLLNAHIDIITRRQIPANIEDSLINR